MCDIVRGVTGRQAGPSNRGTLAAAAGAAAGNPATADQMVQLVRAILALDPRINAPPPRAPLPSSILNGYIAAQASSVLARAGVPRAALPAAVSAVGQAIRALNGPVDRLLAANAAARHLFGWWVVQGAHSRAVEIALVEGFVNGLMSETRRLDAIRASRGGLAHLNLLIAAASPLPNTPAGPVFWMSAVCEWVSRGVSDQAALVRAFVRPDEAAVSLLQGAHLVLSLAFSPAAQAIHQAQQLGAALARAFADEAITAVFPSIATVTVAGVPFSVLMPLPAAAVQTIGPAADLAISPLLVPWSFGAFIGPLLVDIALEVLAPEAGWVAAGVGVARRSPRVRRVLQAFPDAIERVSRAIGLPGGRPHAPAVASAPARLGADTANAAKGVTAPARLTGAQGTGQGAARLNPAGTALAPDNRATLPVPTREHPPHPAGPERGHGTGAPGGAHPIKRRTPAQLVGDYINRKRQQWGAKLADTPATRQALEEIFRRTQDRGEFSVPVHRRAATRELYHLERYLADPDVVRVIPVPSSSAGRTTDFIAEYLDGTSMPVEITALTQAPAGHSLDLRRIREILGTSRGRAFDAWMSEQVRAWTPSDLAEAIRRKVRGDSQFAGQPGVLCISIVMDSDTARTDARIHRALQVAKNDLATSTLERIEIDVLDNASAERRRAVRKFRRQANGTYAPVP